MPAETVVTTTEITVPGANCSWCLNETLDLLRAEPGVSAAVADIGRQCLIIDHDDIAVDRLLAVIRGHLHAEDMTSAERVMVAVDPHVAELRCTHRSGERTGRPHG